MAAQRTQVYLTAQQRSRLDEIARRDRKSLARLIREAVDAYLGREAGPGAREALAATFGATPDLAVPSRDEWRDG